MNIKLVCTIPGKSVWLGFHFSASFVLVMKLAATKWIQDFLNSAEHYVLNVFQMVYRT